MRLTNKLAIITGAGSGFGAGIARRFSEEGCRVVVNDIDAKSGERVAKEIHGTFIQADVTKGADWARLVRAAGPALDIVVNNAGWTHRNKPYVEVTEAEFDKVYAVNVKSVYLSALHAVPVLRSRGVLPRQDPGELREPGVQPRYQPVGRVRRRRGDRRGEEEISRHDPARKVLDAARRRQRLLVPRLGRGEPRERRLRRGRRRALRLNSF